MVVYLQLFVEIFKGVERMSSKNIHYFPVVTFRFSIVTRDIGPDQLVVDARLFKTYLEDSRLICPSMRVEIFREFLIIISLYALNGTRESFYHML